jgi:SAM-dependent methyltransferase
MADFKDHFSSLASQYAAARPHYPRALFDYLAGLCVERRLAWDCACGSGQATLAIAQHFDAVIGTDASQTQVAEATQHPRVEYRVASAEQSGLQSNSVDLVTVAQALHWFDLNKFYAELDRVLKHNGIFAVWSYGEVYVDDENLNRQVRHFYNETVGPYWPPERRIVEEGYRTLPFPYAELTPPRFEMQEQWPLARLLGYFRSWSATGRYIAARGENPVEALGEELAAGWGDPQLARQIYWQFTVRVSRKA